MSLEERLTELERRLRELEKRDMPTLWPIQTPDHPNVYPAHPVTPQWPYGPISTGTPMPWRGSTIC